MSTAGPVKFALSQSVSSQPNAKPVMYQDFNASSATVFNHPERSTAEGA